MLDEQVLDQMFNEDKALSEVWHVREEIEKETMNMNGPELGRYFQENAKKLQEETGIKLETVSFASSGP